MPDQSEFGLPPSSPPSSSPSADPGTRSNRASHSSSCDAPGSSQPRSVDISSGQSSSPYTYDQISITVDQSSVSRTDMEGLPPVSSASGSHGNMASRNNIDASDMDIAAFTALSHYPSVGDDPDFLAISEVVNAVMEGQEYIRNEDSGNNGAPEIASPSHLGNLYMSEPGRNDALGLGAVPIGAYLDGADLGMETIFHQLMNNLAVGHGRLSDDSEEDDDEGDLVMDYESPVLGGESTPLSVQEEDPDDTQKFYMDDDSEYYDDYTNLSQTREGAGQLSDVDFDDFYRGFDLDAFSQMTEVAVAGTNDDHNNYFSDGEDTNAGEQGTEAHFPASVIHGTTHERNFNIDQFIAQWLVQSSSASIPSLPRLSSASPPHPISNILGWIPPETTMRPQRCAREFYDVQQIPWWDALRVKRSDARALRDLWYTSYHNLDYSHQRPGLKLPQEEFYFREKSMHTRYRATIEHFQLRNLMSVPAYNTVHFSHESKVYSWVPGYDDLSCLIDLSKPPVESGFQGSVKISTMKSAHNVCIAGGFTGEYALHSTAMEGGGVQGYVTKDLNGITNHIDIVPSRSSRSPMGIFASNDRHLRVLDCETNTFITDHELSRAINCTSTSPDGRLRVVIGDSPDAWIIEADTGRPVHPLRGHRDFGFACAWSPDMRHIATSNQDKTVIIWDTRTWRILETIESDVAGYRSVRFSPVGGGPRTLLLCEPADRIAIVNAQTYKSRQVHDFFGEIGGADFSPDGSTIWVANTDEHFGGFMEFDRRQWGQQYGPRGLPNEWVRESDLDDDERCLLSERERHMRFWWNLSDEEHEGLLL